MAGLWFGQHGELEKFLYEVGVAHMSEWTHIICDDCWDARHPINPSRRLDSGDEGVCCFCGKQTYSGIYVREDPKNLMCKGQHETDRMGTT